MESGRMGVIAGHFTSPSAYLNWTLASNWDSFIRGYLHNKFLRHEDRVIGGYIPAVS